MTATRISTRDWICVGASIVWLLVTDLWQFTVWWHVILRKMRSAPSTRKQLWSSVELVWIFHRVLTGLTQIIARRWQIWWTAKENLADSSLGCEQSTGRCWLEPECEADDALHGSSTRYKTASVSGLFLFLVHSSKSSHIVFHYLSTYKAHAQIFECRSDTRMVHKWDFCVIRTLLTAPETTITYWSHVIFGTSVWMGEPHWTMQIWSFNYWVLAIM